jgi:Protein of unknown function (Gmx_para_CXXCG)
MRFYKAEIPRRRKLVEGNDANDWESIVCSKNPGHQRAGKRTSSLHIDVLSWNVVDFSRTMLSDIVVTEHALDVLSRAKLTGFTVKAVEVTSTIGRGSESALPKLWEFVVTGRGGPAHKASGIRKLRQCSACGLVEYSAFKAGIVVDASTYDGSDFFSVTEYPRYVLVSERAKKVIEDSRLTNVSFIESTQLGWPEGVAEPT